MDTIPSMKDVHGVSPDHKWDSSGDEEEQMEKLFEDIETEEKTALLPGLPKITPSIVPTSTDNGSATTDASASAAAAQPSTEEDTCPATVWDTGFDPDQRRPSVQGDPKYIIHPEEDSGLHVSESFPHVHHPLKMPPHRRHHHHHHHHHRRRQRTSSNSSATGTPPRKGSTDANAAESTATAAAAAAAASAVASLASATPEATPPESATASPASVSTDGAAQTTPTKKESGQQLAPASGSPIAAKKDTSVPPTRPDHIRIEITPAPETSSALDLPRSYGHSVSDDESGRRIHADSGGGFVVGMPLQPKPPNWINDAKDEPEPAGPPKWPYDSRGPYGRGGGPVYDYCDTDDDHAREHTPLLPSSNAPVQMKPCIRGVDSEGILSSEDDSKPRSKVKFNIGSEVETETEQYQSPRRDRTRSKKRRQRDEASYLWRRHPGNQHPLSQYSSAAEPVAVEEASQLGPKHTDDIASHRFDDAAAYHRTKVRAPRPGTSNALSLPGEDSKHGPGWRSSHAMKKTYDHEPHDMFVELCELRDSTSGPEWREMARWIKFEESVEGVHSDRWGKPHVAFLNFHSLFSLRKGLDRGAVLLDLEETDLTGIVNRTVEYMVACEQIPVDQKDSVISTLLLRRRHVNEDSFGIARRESRTTLDAEGKLKTVSSFVDLGSSSSLTNNLRASIRRSGINKVLSHQSLGSRRHSTFDHRLSASQSNGGFRDRLPSFAGKLEQLETYNPETGEGTRIMETFQNTDLMKKLPEGTEATAVLVGAVDFLKSPTIAFVRLAEGVIMDNMVEVPLPVRFLFVLLGPYHGEMDYHEVGRSISTLMSDKHFSEVAYRAHSRGQLLSAINEFLNASIVLPPAEWSNTDLIPVDQIREKAQEMMKRKQTMRKKRLASEPQLAPVQPPLQRTTLRDMGKKEPPRDPLKRVGKPFYGLYMDLKSRMPLYLSDVKDGLSSQVLAATIFIFFASLSPAITFGGMYAAKTGRLIGVGENLLATAINGILCALFACQPLLIVGATGPLMVFDMALYTFSKSSGLEYLPLRVWIAVWMSVFAVVMAAFEGMTIVKHLTRFTEEIFSTLVCLIFIYGAFEKLVGIFMVHPLLDEYCYDGESLLATIAGTTTPTSNLSDLVELGNVTSSDALAYDIVTASALVASTAADIDISTVVDTTTAFSVAGSTAFPEMDNSSVAAALSNMSFTESVDAVGGLTLSPLNMSDEFSNMTDDLMNTTMAPSTTTSIPPQPNTALLSLLLMFGTFIIAIKLKKFRNSKYLGRGIRRALGDFGVPISIVTMVLVDFLIKDTYTDKLTMPAGIQPSNPDVRGWIINPFGMNMAMPIWAIFAGAPASLLLFTLIMIEGSICQLILSKPERNMKKGSGFHWDMVLVCGLNIISAFIGAPFMTPAVVRTVSHVSALTIMDTKVAPGESPKVVGAHEQRISSLLVSVLVGLSITLSALLNLVPNAVLYGVFLYMGISATAGIQFLERTVLFFMPVKHHPNVPYVKEVRTWKMHLFTLVQVAMIVLLWGVKQSPAALCFPFVLMVLVPLRIFVLPLLWTPTEIYALDGGTKPAGNDEPDFYEEAHNIEHHPAADADDEKES